MTEYSPEWHQQFLRAFTTHEPSLRAFVRKLVPSRGDADDVLQNVAVVLWEKFGQFREGADFKAWAFGVARFEVLAWLRDKGRDRLVLDEDVVLQIADESAADESRLMRHRDALEDCMRKVSPDQRELLRQAYAQNASIQEVALGSGRTVAGFYQWLHRVRRLLLDCIRQSLAQEVGT